MADEIWKDIPGFEGLYEVSSFGLVRRLPRRVFNRGSGHEYTLPLAVLKPHRDKDGYLTLTLHPGAGAKPVGVKVHRLVAQAFLENHQDAPEVDHINRIRDDNRLENLRWASVSLNRMLPEYKGKGVRFREGVHRKKPYQAFVSIDGRFVAVGSYETEEAAAAARNAYLQGANNG